MNQKNTKLEFKKNKVYLKEVQYGLDLGKVAGEVGKTLKLFKNSIKRAYNLSLVYPFKLVGAIARGEDLRKINKEMAAKQRQLSREANSIINSMAGTKDLNAFLGVTNPSVLAVSLGMDAAPEFGESVENFSNDVRKSWNSTVKGIYYAATRKNLESDSFFLLSDDNNYNYNADSTEENYLRYVFEIINNIEKISGTNKKFNLSTNFRSDRRGTLNTAHTKIKDYFKDKDNISKVNNLLKSFIDNNLQQEKIICFEILLNFIGEEKATSDNKKVFSNILSFKNSKDIFNYYNNKNRIIDFNDCEKRIESFYKSTRTNNNESRIFSLKIKNSKIILEEKEENSSRSADDILIKEFQKIAKIPYEQAIILNSIIMINLNYISAEINFSIPFMMSSLLNKIEESFDKKEKINAAALNDAFDISRINKIKKDYENIVLFISSINETTLKTKNKTLFSKKEILENIAKSNAEKNIEQVIKESNKFLNDFLKIVETETSETVCFNFIQNAKNLNVQDILSNPVKSIKEINELNYKNTFDNALENDDIHSKTKNGKLINANVFNDAINKVKKLEALVNDSSINISERVIALEKKVEERIKELSEQEEVDQESNDQESNDQESNDQEDEKDIEK